MAVDPSNDLATPSAGVSLRRLSGQRILDNPIVTIGLANLLPQLRILGHGHSLKLGDEEILRLSQIFLQRVEFLFFFPLDFIFSPHALIRV